MESNGGEIDKAPFNMCYAVYCLLVLTVSMISNTWSRNAMSTFYGYGVEGLKNEPFYAMQEVEGLGLNSE